VHLLDSKPRSGLLIVEEGAMHSRTIQDQPDLNLVFQRCDVTRVRSPVRTPRRLGRVAYVHFRAMSRRCQRRIVSGVTIVAT
jgi:hypothetical protein